MTLKYISLLFIVLLFLACSNNKQFPEPVARKVANENLTMNTPVFVKIPQKTDSVKNVISEELTRQLVQMKYMYERKEDGFDLVEMEIFWEYINGREGNFTLIGVKNWILATGFLLEVTGKEKYAAALEKIQYEPEYNLEGEKPEGIQALLEPYIFTRNNDFFHVNLFVNAAVKFEHSLYGNVEITQETDFPQTGEIKLKFKSEEKRYMEIFVRIPEWAEGTTVTVKGVKYFAPPGDYCLIAKKWREGDLAEIKFPIEKLPAFYQSN